MARRAVGVAVLVEPAFGGAVAESDAAFALDAVERVFVREIIAVVMRHRHADDLAGVVAAGEHALAGLTLRWTSLQWNLSVLLTKSAPGSSPASVMIWKPLQMPSTGVPFSARALTSRMIGECAAMAPQRR